MRQKANVTAILALPSLFLCFVRFSSAYGKKKSPISGARSIFVLILSRNSQAPSFVKKEVIKKVKPICYL